MTWLTKIANIDPNKFPASVVQVNKFLVENGFSQYRLVKGVGYYYFSGADAMQWESSAVAVFRVNQLSFQQWLDELKTLIQHNTR